ncbi:(2,3-dihydroxybenzoyl)adenylate synthase [Natronoglycomyces albus]|uniref:AMP-binding protein n=1 Tax=Natronoglycomyces albus TaxID=2811108 RepID=A0A895XKM8_9ACTN|nr:AMP-binding protein [Natronoglycomyces albus]QSB03979.1 AMP-binding protein [Natronoglycomyces albus]
MDAPFTPWPDEFADRYRKDGYWSGLTFVDLLDQRVASQPDQVAAVDSIRTLTYAQLRENALLVASGLYENGLRRGDIAVVQAQNTCQYLILMFALFRLGVVPVCALPAHRKVEIGYFCRHTAAAAYIHPGGGEYEHIAREVGNDAAQIFTMTDVMAMSGDPTSLPEPPTASELALMQLSGGSTGVPKLIPRTHDDYLYSVRAAAEVCELDSETVFLCALPTAHNFPLSSPGVLGALYAGAQVVYAEDPSPETVFDLIDRHRVTFTSAVPALANMWMDAAQARGWMPEFLQTLQVGGAVFDSERAREVPKILGAGLQQVFGMAEGLVCYTRFSDTDEVIYRTQGRPASPADEIRIVDETDQPVALGEPGHLLTRGPYTIRGYYRADDHNATAFTTDGFYRTGDIVRQNASGNLVVCGRAKDQVNRGGEKISAPEVEQWLRSHPDIVDAAVIGLPDDRLGQRSCAVCVTTNPDLTAKAVRAFVRHSGLAHYKIPDLVRFLPELPHTAIGKIDKKLLREEMRP